MGQQETDGDRQALILEDDGGSLSTEQLTQPFVPFRSTKSEGLGLGLVICQRLLRSQQGELTLENYSLSPQRQGLRVTPALPWDQKGNTPWR